MIPRDLQQLAATCGVLTSYEDVHKRRQQASVESLLAALGALGVPVRALEDVPRALEAQRTERLQRGIEPVLVAWDGGPLEFDLTRPAQQASGKLDCTVEREDGEGNVSQQFDLDRTTSSLSPCGQFVTYRLRLSHGLAWGYYRLRIESSGRGRTGSGNGNPSGPLTSLVISAPRRAHAANHGDRGEWGCFLPLYALRSERNWGAGDFTDLQDFAAWIGDLGGQLVGTLPLLAAFLNDPCEPSPYAPASRLAWNEFYVDVARSPELDHCPKAVKLLGSPAFGDRLRQLRKSDLVDYRGVMALKRQVLELLAESFFERKPARRYARFEQFLEQHPHVEDYAEFRAAYETRGEPWQQWPQPMRGGRLSDDHFDLRHKHYHLYAQWIATAQLETLADAAGGGLYLDLPLGVRPDAYDVWRWNDVFACGASAGSPPDAMWTKGQDWCFPPLHPAKIREQGYQHVRDYVVHHLRLARLLRIDHVMQLHRLYWIPHGMRADQGVYVGYRPEEFYAILNLESHRCQTTLIGENLGTVPLEVNRAMQRHNLQQMYVVQYEIASSEDDSDGYRSPSLPQGDPGVTSHEQPRTSGSAPDAERIRTTSRAADDAGRLPAALHEVPAGALASMNTHDMPTFAAWWRGEDIALRQRLGLLSEKDVRRERLALQNRKTGLTLWLRANGWLESFADETAILRAILKFLAASEAGAVLVNLEDLWLETRPQNVPGTGPELANWRRKAAVEFEVFPRQPEMLEVLQAVAQSRQQSHERSLSK